ncbi:MAG: oxidoreductase [Myxococcales bacterium]|nr:oxidoreductase [Myxococcales bacterium]
MELREPRLFRAELVADSALSPRVRALSLATLGPEPLEWIPGQYLELGLAGADKRMPYSIANAPGSALAGRFELAVLRGSGGGALDELVVGAAVDVFGPCGTFVRSAPPDVPTVFVGTGTGLAPLRAMFQSALEEQSSAPIVVLFGARTEPEILWRGELEALADRVPRFRYEPTLTQPQNGWSGRRGRVQDHLAELVSPLANAHVYLCGLSEMVVDCTRVLTTELGLAASRISTEGH